MKVLFVTIGPRGDVQPYVALGKGLAAAGHEVTLSTNAHFAGFVRAHVVQRAGNAARNGSMSGYLVLLIGVVCAGIDGELFVRGLMGPCV